MSFAQRVKNSEIVCNRVVFKVENANEKYIEKNEFNTTNVVIKFYGEPLKLKCQSFFVLHLRICEVILNDIRLRPVLKTSLSIFLFL